MDPLGLVATDATGYFVYGLYDVDPVTRQLADKPYYVGITNDMDRRKWEHIDSGRLTGTRDTRMKPLAGDVRYGQARGYEQAYIEVYGTKTGEIGVPISQDNRGNKVASFDHNSNTRDPARQAVFEQHYNEKMSELKIQSCKRG